jgi:hypothetical protein
MNRVYVLSNSDELAQQSLLGSNFQNAWKDPNGFRLLPFHVCPEGYIAMNLESAKEYKNQFPEQEII